MRALVLRRLLTAIPTLLLVLLASFALMRFAPGGPFDGERPLAPETRAALEAAYGLNLPMGEQFWLFLKRTLTGDFGPSLVYRDFTVTQLIADSLPVSLTLGGLAILLALALGRDPVSPRLIAAGAFAVLLVWPESLMGPSFQLSFAAVTAIVALHDHPAMRNWAATDLGWAGRAGRSLAMTFLTGLLIEFTLMPIALHHFGKAGLYGALANMIAIPLTTFVIMPLEALALLLDLVGIGAPFWWLCGVAIEALIDVAHAVADTPGAVALFPRSARLCSRCSSSGGCGCSCGGRVDAGWDWCRWPSPACSPRFSLRPT